ncbi:MAG: hypothetical protein R3E97_14320 [Candidatus Eisenbacteria bacterium]
MDEIGFYVSSIDDESEFLVLNPAGGSMPPEISSRAGCSSAEKQDYVAVMNPRVDIPSTSRRPRTGRRFRR